MLPAGIVFVLVALLVLGVYAALTWVPAALERRALERRIREVGQTVDASEITLVRRHEAGPLPAVDRLVAQTTAGSRLARLIEQAGARTTPSAVLLMTVLCGMAGLLLAQLFIRQPIALAALGCVGAALPLMWLMHRRSARLKRFEEQFPEALELVSRAIRAGHAFQAAMGMVADELTEPVGPEFRKTFDQQNFGLPVQDALAALAERVPLVDVKFFVTAVAIQRDTGGNLAEILDNLAHVVRERFKIQRQVRVHTAHGRITAFVLLGLPAFLAVALSFINPEHMNLLFEERMGQTMLAGIIVMEIVGFFWIRQVIRIEV